MTTWSIRELVAAALCLPTTVGWSGTWDSQLSRLALKVSTVPPCMSLMSLGSKLYSLAPFTCRDDSLAFLTAAADPETIGGTNTVLPLLSLC